MTQARVDDAAATPAPRRKLLIGGPAITRRICGDADKETLKKNVRWLYGQLPHLACVVWQLAEDGTLYAFEDDLLTYFETKAAEAKIAALATAATKTAEREATAKAAAKTAQPSSRRRPRAQLRKTSRVAAE